MNYWIMSFETMTKFLEQIQKIEKLILLQTAEKSESSIQIIFPFIWSIQFFFEQFLYHNTVYSFINSVSK